MPQYEMIGCSSRERGVTRAPFRRLSRITMEITTSLGSHTVAVAFFVGHFVSTHAFDTAPPSVPPYSLLFPIYLLLSFSFRASIRSKVEHARAEIREKANDPGLLYGFVLPRRAARPLRSSLPLSPVSTFLTVKLSLPSPIISALLRKHSAKMRADRDAHATRIYQLNRILNTVLFF